MQFQPLALKCKQPLRFTPKILFLSSQRLGKPLEDFFLNVFCRSLHGLFIGNRMNTPFFVKDKLITISPITKLALWNNI